MFIGAFEPQNNVATTVGLAVGSSTYGNTNVLATVLAVGGVSHTSSSGNVAFDYFSGGVWLLAGSSAVDGIGQAFFAFNSLPVGATQVRARYTSNSAWFTNSNSAPISFNISQAQTNVYYDFISQSVQARGARGENFNSGLTIFYSNNGGTTFSSTPPTATGYAIYYTLTADVNHVNVTTPTFVGNLPKIVGEPTQVFFDGQRHSGRVRAIGLNGEDLSSSLRFLYQPVFEDGSTVPLFALGINAYIDPSRIGFFRVHYYSQISGYLNPSFGGEVYTGATVMINDPNRVVGLNVTTLVDENDGTWYPALGSGLSLREAIEYANAHAGVDTITFAPNVAGTMTLSGTRLPDAQSDLTITGPGADVLAISGNSQSAILNAVGTSIQISGLAFTGGNSIVGGAFSIAVGASVTIDASELHNNIATGTSSINGDGGAILNRGTLTLRNSTLRNNSAVNGGGIYNATGATLNVQNSTLAENAATFGGGVHNLGLASFLNSTIAFNRSNVGGGIRATTFGVNATTTLMNTILGGNTNFGGTAPQDFAGGGSFTSQSTHNLIGPGGSGGLVNGVSGNIVVGSVAALRLGTLTNNGGRTRTIAILLGSPAINAGNNTFATNLANDQRGVGFARLVGSSVDIGAFESGPVASLTSIVANGGDAFLNSAQRSQITSLVVTFDFPVVLAPGAFTIANTGLVTAQAPVALAASQILVNGSGTTYTITFGSGSGVITRHTSSGLGRGNSLADGNFLLTIDPTKVTSVNGGARLSPTNNFGDGDNEFGDRAVDNFFRLFGDTDGNGIVNSLDTGAFAKALTTYNAAVDFNGDGVVQNSGADRTNFLANFNKRRRTTF